MVRIHQHAKFQAISYMHSPGNSHKPQILPVALSKKSAIKLEKSTNCDNNLISSESAQDKSACKISGHSLHAFTGKCPETTNLTRFIKLKWRQRREINRPWPKSNQFWRWSGYINMQTFRLFHAFSGKCPETYSVGRTDTPKNGHG